MIGIFVCTYKRPVVRDCLLSLIESIEQTSCQDVEIHVIDNDASGSGKQAFDSVVSESDFPLFYHLEGSPGIASARNRCLELAANRCQWLLFVDDDETVAPEWFGGYLSVFENSDAVAYVGLVETVYPEYVKDEVRYSGLHDRSQKPHLQMISSGACNNCALSIDFIEKHQLRFDDRYNSMMGEDSDLFERIHRLGGVILWNAHSIVYEILVPERATRDWAYQRYQWVGETYALRKKRYMSRMGIFKELVQSVLNSAVAFGLSWLCFPWPAKHVKFYAYFIRNRAKVRAFLNA